MTILFRILYNNYVSVWGRGNYTFFKVKLQKEVDKSMANGYDCSLQRSAGKFCHSSFVNTETQGVSCLLWRRVAPFCFRKRGDSM